MSIPFSRTDRRFGEQLRDRRTQLRSTQFELDHAHEYSDARLTLRTLVITVFLSIVMFWVPLAICLASYLSWHRGG